MWKGVQHCVFMTNYCKMRENVSLNVPVKEFLTSKLYVSDPQKLATQFFSLNRNFAFHSLIDNGVVSLYRLWYGMKGGG